MFRNIFRIRPIGLIGVLILALGVNPGLAEEAPNSASSNNKMNETQRAAVAVQQRAQEVGSEINKIREATIKSHPELQEQQKELKALVEDEMVEQGVDLEKRSAELQGLEERIREKGADDKERQQLLQRYVQKSFELRQEQQKALQAPGVKEELEAYQERLVELMKQTDPRTDELMGEMEDLKQRYQKLQASLQSQKPQQR